MKLSLYDFQGGYANTIPSSLLMKNELLQAENCFWDNGLKARKGRQVYTVHEQLLVFDDDSHVSTENGSNMYIAADHVGSFIVGLIRTDISGEYESLYAISLPGIGMTIASGDYEFTFYNTQIFNETDYVELAQFGNKWVVGVSGTDEPFAIWYEDGQYHVETLNNLDIRIRDPREYRVYKAVGSVEDSEDISEELATPDDVVDLTDGDAGDALFIACDFLFNRVEITGLVSTDKTPIYAYSKGNEWIPFTPTTDIDWSTSGNHVLEFDLPFEGTELQWQISTDLIPSVTERFSIRILFEEAHVAPKADLISLKINQYFRLVMGNQFGEKICIHNSRVQISSGNVVHFSPVNKITDWRTDEVEYFQEGGNIIQNMVSFPNALIVFKTDAIYALTGNSYQTYSKRMVTREGTIAPDSVVVLDQETYYLARDGIRSWNGSQSVVISKHIQDDVPFDPKATATAFRGNYLISFPSTNTALTFDPDSARRRENGDGVVSFYKYTNYGMQKILYAFSNNDTGFLYGIPTNVSLLYRLDIGDTDDGEPIVMKVKTLYFTFNAGGSDKRLGRIKPEVIAPGEYTLAFEADDGLHSTALTVDSGTTGIIDEISLPYELDGRNIAFLLEKEAPGGLRAIHLEVNRRKY